MNSRPNILFLLSDEHSFRCMGHVSDADGGEPVDTPTFDRLAARGTVFSTAYCQMPLCTPSRIAMLTGKEVRKSGAWTNNSVLRPELATIPSVLRDSGYTTCLVGKMHLGGTQQFVGFEHRPYGDLTGKCGHQWEPIDDKHRLGMRTRTAHVGVTGIPESLLQDQVVCHETVAFLREHQQASPDKPWFLCASFSRPHFPLTTPKRWIDRYWPDGVTRPRVPATGDAYDHPMSVGMREGFKADAIADEEMMRARAAYFACVSYLDEVLGDLFQRLESSGLLDNTVIIYTTDHGEMAGEHGVWWKNGWYEACTRVPLIVSTPGQRRGDAPARHCSTPVSLADLFPTIASIADADTPDDLDGVDLSPVLDGSREAPDRPIYCDALTPRWGAGTEFRSIRQGRFKYVAFRDAPPLAFDVVADPGEQRNLLQHDMDAETRAAVDALARHAAESIDFDAAGRERAERDGELGKTYAQDLPAGTANLYVLPDGRVVSAETPIYEPQVVADSPTAAFGKDWQRQNARP
jgi:choline-sulfatase